MQPTTKFNPAAFWLGLLYAVQLILMVMTMGTYAVHLIEPPPAPNHPFDGVGLVIVCAALISSLWVTTRIHISMVGEEL